MSTSFFVFLSSRFSSSECRAYAWSHFHRCSAWQLGGREALVSLGGLCPHPSPHPSLCRSWRVPPTLLMGPLLCGASCSPLKERQHPCLTGTVLIWFITRCFPVFASVVLCFVFTNLLKMFGDSFRVVFFVFCFF